MDQTTSRLCPFGGYNGLPETAIDSIRLAEIGRVIAHHGMLVYHVMEFTSKVNQLSDHGPVAIDTMKALETFPIVVNAIKGIFDPDERRSLKQAIYEVGTARDWGDLFVGASIGSGPTRDEITIVRYRKYRKHGIKIDRTTLNIVALRRVASEISTAVLGVKRLLNLVKEKVYEDPERLRKLINKSVR